MVFWLRDRFFTALLALAASIAGCTPDNEPEDSPGSTGGRAATDPSVTVHAKSCRDGRCSIVLRKLVTISDGAEPGILGDRVVVVQDTWGRIFTESRRRDRVLVFDSAGNLIKQIGRQGRGPGEFTRALTPMIGPGDTLFVPDLAPSRLTVIGPDLQFAGVINSSRLPTFVLQDRTFIIADQIATAGAIGFPIHRMDTDGRILRSFGADTPQHRPDLRLITTRVVSVGRNGTVWAAAPGRYVLERWDWESGSRLQRVTVASPWFRESSRFESEGERPVPIIERIFEDEAGLLWVLIRDADTNWKRPAQKQWERVWEAAEYDADHDWVLEVVDPSSQRVIATERFATALRSAPSTQLFTSRRDMAPDIVAFDVWTPLLRPKEEP